MVWAEANRVDYVFGLARNERLSAEIEAEMEQAQVLAEASGKSARRFRDFRWATLTSWSRTRRVIGKAEWTQGKANPRFIVTSLPRRVVDAKRLYEDIYCVRGEMENRIRNARWTCSPTAPQRRPCGPTSCGCGLPALPTCCCARCAASVWCIRSLRVPPAARSACGC